MLLEDAFQFLIPYHITTQKHPLKWVLFFTRNQVSMHIPIAFLPAPGGVCTRKSVQADFLLGIG